MDHLGKTNRSPFRFWGIGLDTPIGIGSATKPTVFGRKPWPRRILGENIGVPLDKQIFSELVLKYLQEIEQLLDKRILRNEIDQFPICVHFFHKPLQRGENPLDNFPYWLFHQAKDFMFLDQVIEPIIGDFFYSQ